MSKRPEDRSTGNPVIDWETAANLPPDELDRLLEDDHDEIDDNPEMLDDELGRMVLMSRHAGEPGPGKRPAKVPVTIRMDPATLAAFKATGQGWQRRVDDILREAAQRRLKPSATEARPKRRA